MECAWIPPFHGGVMEGSTVLLAPFFVGGGSFGVGWLFLFVCFFNLAYFMRT